MNLISIFEYIRDIPYKIPLSLKEEDNCCSGKHERLFNLLKNSGYTVRYRVCVFLWKDLGIPSDLKNIPHDKECTHTYLEINLNNEWKILDATWDIGLEDVFSVNKRDGKSNTEIAVNPIKIFTPQKSLEIINNEDKTIINEDLKVNGKFYKGFNVWLDSIRK